MLAIEQTAPPPAVRPAHFRGWFWLGLLAAMACGTLWSFNRLPDASARLAEIPRRGPHFESSDVPLTETEREAFARVSLVHRLYRFEGREFYVTVIDGTHDRHVVHDPRYCFQGAGWHVLEEARVPLTGGEATWMRGGQEARELQAVFWFSDGKTRHASPLRYWWQSTLRRLSLGRSGPEPVLIVVQSFGNDQPVWPELAQKVATTLAL
jgi:hypothetical protein